jgi:hypothetical protein
VQGLVLVEQEGRVTGWNDVCFSKAWRPGYLSSSSITRWEGASIEPRHRPRQQHAGHDVGVLGATQNISLSLERIEQSCC